MPQLPEGFIAFIHQHEALKGLDEALLTQPETSIRLNPAKVSDISCVSGETVPWCPEGRYLSDRPQFTFDPKLHQGIYYVQDASSMAITAAIRHITSTEPVRYLDACAAPGGKTTAAIASLPDGSVVVANEYDFRRAEILAENLSKWGNSNIVVSRGNTSKLSKLNEYFDIVAVDAPCSGEGMMRKDAQAIAQWSPSLIEQCSATQKEIIENVWKSLRPGGYLIYSTCTFNTTENEHNLEWLVKRFGAEPINIPALDNIDSIVKGIDTPHPCYRFLPGRIRGEGLFMAVVRKPGDKAPLQFRSKPLKAITTASNNWFDIDVEFRLVDNELFAIPSINATFINAVASKLDTILIGTHTATVKGKDVIPTHQLALAQHLNTEAFCKCELSEADAIKYLQRENIVIPEGTPKGNVLLFYDGNALGFVKNLGNRSNSMMPKNWRILSRQK